MQLNLGRILLAIAAVLAAGAIIWSLLPSPIPVETAQVTMGRFVATVDEDGITRVRERYVVAAPLAGRLTRLPFEAGDRVAANDVIASILPSPAPLLNSRSRREAEERVGAAEATRERTRAIVERAVAQAGQAKTDLERTRTLTERGVSTQQALERNELASQVAERELRAAQFQDHAAEHELEQARAALGRYNRDNEPSSEPWMVTAPVAGVVLRILQKSETIVAPGTPLVEIGDPGVLEIVVDVLSSDAVEIQPGAETAIERWGGPNSLAGRVRRVEPGAFTKISTLGVEEQRVNVLIDLVSPPEVWSSLGDGFRVEARIAVFSRDNATIIPSGALFRVGDGWNVYVVSNGRAQLRKVEVLRRSGRAVAIAAGLTVGESVIVYPSDRIAPSVRVSTK